MDTFFLALRVLLSLAVVLGLLWVMQRKLTRTGRAGRRAELVTVVARQGISPKASVVIVDAEGKRFLLGITEQSVNVLHTGDIPGDESGVDAFALTMNAALAAPATLTSVPTYGGDNGVPGERRTGRRAARSVGSIAPPAAKPALGGSILSADTWKQTVAAIRQGRNG